MEMLTNTDAIVLYLKERLTASASVTWQYNEEQQVEHIEVYIEGGLTNDIYVQPLTLLFEIPKNWVNRPLQIEGPTGRLPDQISQNTQSMMSFAPTESKYTITLATNPYPSTNDDAGLD